MGNKTAALLEDYKTKEDVQMHMINAVQTRAQNKLLEVENEVQGQSIEQFDEELNDDLPEDEKKSIEEVLTAVKELSVQYLIKTSPKVFVEEQNKREQLKPLIADAKLNVSKENKYVLEKNMLFFKKRDKNGTERKLLVVPEKFCEHLKTFCHEAGELVLVIAPSRRNKLSVQGVGPGEVVQPLSEANYGVQFPERDKTPVYNVNMLKPYHQREENINLLCINPLKYAEEEDMSSLELENEISGWSKIISDVHLNSKLSQIQQVKELLHEYSNIFRIFLDVLIYLNRILN
ncbi:retrovirus-related Pol polyprotein from transposon 412 [Trichonephila inaurata madagascariensis]|uniref:Retrovirus-related Pol polyprotein from transposon 412 n=1 Tax=Trichonephila inaurata madagascariensis TaxID=2747483 RepID=A0A8X6X2U4_9ARAC|nr:retrovirus-related Pol polyprotein from transposon 412 [Trichonephila inaurata madagascariensis]